MDKLCVCGGDLISWEGWHVCVACGGAMTHSGKYLPPRSGWAIPVLPEAARRACTCGGVYGRHPERGGPHRGWCQVLRVADAYQHLRGAP